MDSGPPCDGSFFVVAGWEQGRFGRLYLGQLRATLPGVKPLRLSISRPSPNPFVRSGSPPSIHRSSQADQAGSLACPYVLSLRTLFNLLSTTIRKSSHNSSKATSIALPTEGSATSMSSTRKIRLSFRDGLVRTTRNNLPIRPCSTSPTGTPFWPTRSSLPDAAAEVSRTFIHNRSGIIDTD